MRRGNKQKFGRPRKQRQALAKSLATALIQHGKIVTTSARAKLAAGVVEKLITGAKKGTIASRRLLTTTISKAAAHKLATEFIPAMRSVHGGHTRVTRIGRRTSDGAPMMLVELIK